jgi:excisionase family DNA binding protein
VSEQQGIPQSSRQVANDALLNADEVAALLSVPVRWVREHTRGGLIPHVRLGRYIRYRRPTVLAWIIEQEHHGAAWRKHRPRLDRYQESVPNEL